MNTAFGELAQARERRQRRWVRLSIVCGLVLMVLGYMAMAVPPETELGWALLRVGVGLSCIMAGFGLCAWPLLARWTSSE